MIKKYILIILGLFLPILVVFGTYRVALGYAPLNTKALVETLSLAFNQTSHGIIELFELIEEIASYVEGSIEIFEADLGGINYDNTSIFTAIKSLFAVLLTVCEIVVMLCVKVFDLAFILIKIVGYIITDIMGLLKILMAFLVDSSPYQIDPYYKPIS